MDTYIYKLGAKEESLAKRKKIDALRLSSEEWECVGMFCDLLRSVNLIFCISLSY